MDINDKIFVAGHRGLVGSAIVEQLQTSGYKNIITKNRIELDLSNQLQVEKFFEEYRPDYVFDAAARVGGIYANNTYPAEFIYENLMIQNNLIHNSWKYGVKKFLFMGSVCIYPKYAETPVKEESLLTGLLESTNEAYAIAKIAGIKMCEAYYKQYGFPCVSVMPCNLFGPNDNFDINNGHVIPAMIHKFSDASSGPITLWGDGSPRREFLYSSDMADACIFLMNHIDVGNAELINIGSGNDITIKDLAEILLKVTGFKGGLIWDKSRPNGTPKRNLDSTRLNNLGWHKKTDFEKALTNTYHWYLNNEKNKVF
jgi:GDP-L-fucose synthase